MNTASSREWVSNLAIFSLVRFFVASMLTTELGRDCVGVGEMMAAVADDIVPVCCPTRLC